MRKILSAFGKLGILALVAVLFAVGLLLSVYLSLRSPEVQVPDVVNQPYLEGGNTLERAGLDIRERASRFKPGVQPGVILDQSPRAGSVIKEGQTVAVVVSRAPREGEQPPDEEVAEERRAEEKTGTRTENSNVNANANRERRRASNRNSNANSNAATNTNASVNGNSNAPANRNAAPANRNAANSNTRNANAPANRNTSTRNTNTRNTNSGRPGAANANRRP